MSSSHTIPPVEPKPETITQIQDPRTENPPWNLLDVLAIVSFAVLSVLIFQFLVAAVAHALPPFRHLTLIQVAEKPIVAVIGQAIAYLLIVVFMAQIVHLRQQPALLTAISWNPSGLETVLRALAGGAGLAVLGMVYDALTSRWMPKSLPIEKYFSDTTTSYFLALFGIIFAPFVEELFFRGFLYPALARRIGTISAVSLTAASFAVIHQGQLAHAWVPLTWLFIVGTVLTLVRARTRSVALCVAIHMGYNVTLFAVTFIGTHGFRMEHA